MATRSPSTKKDEAATAAQKPAEDNGGFKAYFSIPTPVKMLFDKVPMVVYAPNELPERAQRSARIPNLYIFSTEKDATAGQPSFNPSCLKWQVRCIQSLRRTCTDKYADFFEHRRSRPPTGIFKQSRITFRVITLPSSNFLRDCSIIPYRVKQIYQIRKRAWWDSG